MTLSLAFDVVLVKRVSAPKPNLGFPDRTLVYETGRSGRARRAVYRGSDPVDRID
jgi:hypothetical protein